MIKNNTNKKGFTLAEMMLSMLIVSIILAAIMPTIIKNVKVERDHIWRWANSNSIYFSRHDRNGGAGQSAIYVGLPAAPDYHNDNETKVNQHEIGAGETSLYSPFGIYTHNLTGHPLNSSHIDLYEKEDDSIKYVGRIATDDYNIAFGIGTLQKLQVTYDDPSLLPKYNTGIGQFSLYNNTTGKGNTAIGYSALRNNIAGQYNTAVGSLAGKNYRYGEDNTLIGYSAGTSPDNNQSITDGNRNTIIGAYACGKKKSSGDDSDNGFSADRNICIGYNAAGNYEFDKRNSKDRIFIGSDYQDSGSVYIPLISGHTNYNSDLSSGVVDYDKDIEFNLKKFNINTFDGEKSVYEYSVEKNGSGGYMGESTSKYYIENSSGGNELFTGYKLYSDFKKISDDDSDDSDRKKIIDMDVYSAQDNNGSKFNFNEDALTFRMNVKTASSLSIAIPEINFSSEGKFSIQSGHKCIDLDDGCTGYGKIQLTDDGLKLEAGSGIEDSDGIDAYSSNDFSIGSDRALFFGSVGGYLSLNSEKKDIDIISKDDVFFRLPGNSMEEAFKIKLQPTVSVYGTKTVMISANASSPYINVGNDVSNYTLINAQGLIANDVSTNFGDDTMIKDANTLLEAKKIIYDKLDTIPESSGYSSDLRLKNVSGDNNAGLEEINKLQVKNFTYKNDRKKELHVGVIAQDLQKIFPNSVFKDNDGYLKIKTEEIFYALINSIKQLFAKIQDLTNKISEIDKNLSNMENETEMIKTRNDIIEKRLRKLEQKQEIRSGKHE